MAGTFASAIFFLVTTFPAGFTQVAGRGLGVKPGPSVRATRGEIWPKPQNQLRFENYMLLDPNSFNFTVTENNCDILQDAIQRYSQIIRNMEEKSEIAELEKENEKMLNSSTDFAGYLSTLSVNLLLSCESLPHPEMDEKYELFINTPDYPRKAVLSASSIWGILRGLESFSQLIYSDGYGSLMVNGTAITDFPRYSHRGLLIDTSRHYIPLRIIYSILDGMSFNKYNVFHWHIVDDQSFPYESKTFPQLSKYGAYSPYHVYTQEDVANIIKYAAFRGIRVIPEFDSPGHTRSWGNGHPELLTKCYGKNGPDGTLGPMNPIVDNTYNFMDKILDEISSVFPDEYVHLGGDEVDQKCWASNPDIYNYVKKNKLVFADVEEMYIKKIIDLCRKKALKPIVWQEVFDNGLEIPMDTIIQVWKTANYQEELSRVTKQGYKALLSSPWYLDHMQSGGDWIKYYNLDPENFAGTDEEKKRLIGGEACMWSEHVDVTNIMTRIWPRACAAAEKLWSPKGSKNYHEAATRLEEHSCRMNGRGVPTQPPNGPGFCLALN